MELLRGYSNQTDALRRLTALLAELDDEEQNSLQPVQARREAENAGLCDDISRLKSQNALLTELDKRQAAMSARARRQLDELLQEEILLQAEYQRALNIPQGRQPEGAR